MLLTTVLLAPAVADRYLLPAGAQQQTRRRLLQRSIDGTEMRRDDRRTDARSFHRPCFAYYAAGSRAVLTNGHTGHVPRAPGFFFIFEGPPTGCGEINYQTNYLIVAINETVQRLTVFVIRNRPTVKGCSCAALG